MVVLTVIEIVVLIAGLAFFLYWTGSLLGKIATTLEAGDGLVQQIRDDATLIRPGLKHINATGARVSGALPLLYGYAEEIIEKVNPVPDRAAVARPASGTRRSRILDTVGFRG
ncbi:MULTISPECIES: hypothetical protein [unclassified Pseudonocardia]|jgi:hypothetical protein|uniref:hypothetical protein n=1 Tax=unclassified Pseudonocardia TaxID=2619320 RepID=UPI0009666ACA|nr:MULTISPECIES: hypothetical protein [unclassified Pseudonocardia]MBN9097157.1 hypothetical protein [Pseudonocardia sp.]OJY39468.1 MAG: hypothetical protein BGP03_30515 [Pseudonocardia sp. 73-21]